MIGPHCRPLVGRSEYHELVEMIADRFSKRLICKLLNNDNVSCAKFGEGKVYVMLWLTWCEDVWPLLWIGDFPRSFQITHRFVVVAGRFGSRGWSCPTDLVLQLS